MEATKIPVSRRTIGYGTADAIRHADVPTQVASTVRTLPLTTRVGHAVAKGDLLIALDDVDFAQKVVQAQLAISTAKSQSMLLGIERSSAEDRAELAMQDQALAEAELQRVEDAFAKGVAKQREVDQAKQKLISVASSAVNATEISNRFPALEEQASATVETRKAELTLAEENLKRCKIVSPIDGVIQTVDVRVGEHVSNGQRVARIVNSSNMEIPLRLPSYARSHINVYDSVLLRSAGFGKRFWDARVSRIAPEDDSSSRTMIAYIDVEQNPASANRIPPGLFLRGEVINAKSDTERWVVPRRALRDDRLLIVRDSVLHSVPVIVDFSMTGEIPELALPDYDWAVLETPLTLGDYIVVDPGGSLRDGMSVRSILATEVSLE